MHRRVMIVGAGVVGRAIALDHLGHQIPVWIADRDEEILSRSCDWLLQRGDGTAISATPWDAHTRLPVVCLLPDRWHADDLSGNEKAPWLLIESIAERLDVKQAFFAEAESWFSGPVVLTTNTSTLSIEKISESLKRPESFCGFHFFMPVVGRHAVEVIAHEQSSSTTIEVCCEHAKQLDKTPVSVVDSPGFIVNRMLTPYLNLSLWLLCGGVPAETIRRAALNYGMPMSPLELIDLIGPRTAFDGGRVVWQAFPQRIDPSPLLPAMVKRKMLGVNGGEGFYRYDGFGQRADSKLTPTATELIERYRHDDFLPSVDSQLSNRPEAMLKLVSELFAGVMRSEAEAIIAEEIADAEKIAAVLRGGLAWQSSSAEGPLDAIEMRRCRQLASDFSSIRSLRCFVD